MYGFCAAHYGVENRRTCASLLHLGSGLWIGGEKGPASLVLSRAYAISKVGFIGEIFILRRKITNMIGSMPTLNQN